MRTLLTATVTAAVLATAAPALASEAAVPPSEHWSFQGVFGTYDRGALQRGFQVYREVCHSCHALSLVAYRNLEAIGLPPDQVKAIAAEYEVEAGPNDDGDMFMRPALPSDRFVPPFPNEQAARAANGGAYPPDLSLITKARLHGVNYVHALLLGYKDPAPEGAHLLEGMYYNTYFPGNQIGMPPPLVDGRVDYPDGTEATMDQMARDVGTFLSWAAEPELEMRKRIGVSTLLFLIVLTGLLYALKREIWSDVHH